MINPFSGQKPNSSKYTTQSRFCQINSLFWYIYVIKSKPELLYALPQRDIHQGRCIKPHQHHAVIQIPIYRAGMGPRPVRAKCSVNRYASETARYRSYCASNSDFPVAYKKEKPPQFAAAPINHMFSLIAEIRMSPETTRSSAAKPSAKFPEYSTWALGGNSSSPSQTRIRIL